METKDIDLTKCKGLCFKASIERLTCEGKIQVEKGCVYLCQNIIDGAECQDRLGFKYSWGILDGSKKDMKRNHITDFEIVPRDPETYRDWQVGDKVTCPDEKWNDSAYKEIIFRSGELVICKDGNGDISGGYTCGQLHRLGYRLVLTDIERQIIEERKKAEWKPQDGDVCFVKTSAGNRFIFIKRDNESDDEIHGYASIDTNSRVLYLSHSLSCVCDRESIRNFRPATDEEKQLLFDAMAKKGKRWNAEKKVVEDIPKPYEFKKGEPVLVRDNGCVWKIGVFTKMRADYFQYGAMTNGLDECGYHFCIPYNEKTMHLLGTSDDYKEGE